MENNKGMQITIGSKEDMQAAIYYHKPTGKIQCYGEPDELLKLVLSMANDGINYKTLLGKYIKYVGQVEGTTFLDHYRGNDGDIEFTKQEWEALQEINKNNQYE